MSKYLFIIFLFVIFNTQQHYASAQLQPLTQDLEEEFRAGFGAVDITPKIGVPLGGYGGLRRHIIPFDIFDNHPYATFLKPSVGVLDPLRSKALVFEKGPDKVLFLSLDVVGISGDFYDELMSIIKPLGFQSKDVFITATHTHSGPGAISRSFSWQLIAMDSFVPEVYEKLKLGVLSSIKIALESLEPSSLFVNRFKIDGIQQNRRDKKAIVDNQANMLFVKAQDGTWQGGVVNFSVHGTAYGMDNNKFSADLPGGIERAIEDKLKEENGKIFDEFIKPDPIVLFFNGAFGDIKPKMGGQLGIDSSSLQFSNKVVNSLITARQIRPFWQTYTTKIKLKNKAGFNLWACVGGKEQNNIPKNWIIPANDVSNTLRVSVMNIDGEVFVTWPGESTSALGVELKNKILGLGASGVWILGASNGHSGYFTTPSEFEAGGYEVCMAFFGPNAGEQIINNYCDVLLHEFIERK